MFHVFENDDTNEHLRNVMVELAALNEWLGHQPDEHRLSINGTWLRFDKLYKELQLLLNTAEGEQYVLAARWAISQPVITST